MESTYQDVQRVYTQMARLVGFYDQSPLQALADTQPQYVDATALFQPLIDLYDDRALRNPSLALPAEASEWLLRAVAWHCAGSQPQLYDVPSVPVPDGLVTLFNVQARTATPELVDQLEELLTVGLTSTTQSPGQVADAIGDVVYRSGPNPFVSPINGALQQLSLTLPAAVKLTEILRRVFQSGYGAQNRFNHHLYLAWVAVQCDPQQAAAVLYEHLSPYELSSVTETIWQIWLASVASKRFSLADESFITFFERRQGFVYRTLHSYFEDATGTQAALTALAMLPTSHRRLLTLWSREALYNPNEAVRERCRSAVAKYPERVPVVQEALRSSKPVLRIAAAQWASQAPHPDLEADLVTAFRSETHGKVRSALLSAVEAQGIGLADELTVADLAAMAKQRLKLPPDAQWLAEARLPSLRWRGSDAVVAPAVQGWLVATAVDEASGAPSSVLRFAAGLCAPAGVTELAEWFFTQWLAQDLAVRSFEDITVEATRYAYDHLEQQAQWLPTTALLPGTEAFEDEAAQLIRRKVAELIGAPHSSAVTTRGGLALAALAVTDQMVTAAQDYLLTWPKRRAQCVALLEMLASSAHVGAHDVVLQLSVEHPVASVRQDALAAVPLIARHTGLSSAQLADRRVPRFGFDAAGRKQYPMRGSMFTAVISDQFTVEVTQPGGVLAEHLSLAAMRADVTKVREQLGPVVRKVRRRLELAMVTGRRWPVELWRHDIVQHPVTGRFARQLVWWDVTAERLFGVRADGVLVDVAGAVVAEPVGNVELAFTSRVGAAEAAVWLARSSQQLSPVTITQFGHHVPDRSLWVADQTRLEDFEGHVLSGAVFAELAQLWGFEPGPVGVDDMVFDWQVTYPSLGLVATLTCSGMHRVGAPQQVALHHMTFAPVGFAEQLLPLTEVPDGVLVKAWHDLVEFAQHGTGFQANWPALVP